MMPGAPINELEHRLNDYYAEKIIIRLDRIIGILELLYKEE